MGKWGMEMGMGMMMEMEMEMEVKMEMEMGMAIVKTSASERHCLPGGVVLWFRQCEHLMSSDGSLI